MFKLSFFLLNLFFLTGCALTPEALTELEPSHTQAILVQTHPKYRSIARLTLWQRTDSGWHKEYPTVGAVVGRNGLAQPGMKKEGDGHTPQGTFDLKSAFGYTETLPTGLDYRPVTKDDLWVDDPASVEYNTWVKAPTQAKSFEVLRRDDHLYKMAAVIEYNTAPIVSGAGSAIFMHIWRRYDHPTAGCVGLSERNLKKILSRLDKSFKPVIILEEHGRN